MKNIPEPQAYLNESARKIYFEIGSLLEKVGALEDVDSFGLSIMAMDLYLFREAAESVSSEGAVQITPNGYSQITGHFTVMEKCKTSFLKYSEKFGLSPKDRDRMLKFKKQPKQEDQIDKLLK